MSSLVVACWNVLADCYTSLQWEKRKGLLKEVLRGVVQTEHISFLLLQEVDHVEDFYRPLLTSLTMKIITAPRPCKEDSCIIAYNDTKLQLIAEEMINFNDLAGFVGQGTENYKSQTFLRHNTALVACFMCRETSSYVTVANTHLYWNPNFPEVKNGQLKYLLDRMYSFQCKWNILAGSRIVLGGDFNSLPGSEVYSLLTKPFACIRPTAQKSSTKLKRRYLLSAKHQDGKLSVHSHSKSFSASFICDDTLSKFCRWLRLLGISCTMLKATDVKGEQYNQLTLESSVSDEHNVNPSTISAAGVSEKKPLSTKETIKAEKARKKLQMNNMYFSEISKMAREEDRILLTTNKQWQQRADAPENFLVDYTDLESSIVELFCLYNLELNEDNFLTICGKCGGKVITCDREQFKVYHMENCTKVTFPLQPKNNSDDESNVDDKEDSLAENLDLPWVPLDQELFCCERCFQPYWTNDKPTSSFGKALQMANTLKDSIESKLTTLETGGEEIELHDHKTGVLDENDENVLDLRSCHSESYGCEPPHTNWTEDFLGTLDYIFVTPDVCVQATYIIDNIQFFSHDSTNNCCVKIESSYQKGHRHTNSVNDNEEELEKDPCEEYIQSASSGPFPNSSWPSDHLMILSTLSV